MPVYLRRNGAMSVPSASSTDFAMDCEEDFILDPDQFRDSLPQPFRLIDKILSTLVDSVVDSGLHREAERVREASKFRPPQYKSSAELQKRTSCLSSSKDEQFVFLGSIEGLAALDALSGQTLAQWRGENVEIVALHVAMIGEFHLISTLDDFGVARLFTFAGQALYLIHTFTESGHTSDSKMIAAKCECSSDGDYVGVFFVNTLTQSGWLEVHKIPKDVWHRELENLVSAAFAKKQKAEEESVADTQNENSAATGEEEAKTSGRSQSRKGLPSGRKSVAKSHKTDKRSSSRQASKRKPAKNRVMILEEVAESPCSSPAIPDLVISHGRDSATSSRASSRSSQSWKSRRNASPSGSQTASSPVPENVASKFGAPTLVFKVKSPHTAEGINWTSPIQVMKSIDSTGEVVGSGACHQVSQQHLDLRQAMFRQLHTQLVSYEKKDPAPNPIDMGFHFLFPGRMMPQGAELSQGIDSGPPTSIAVWWSDHPQINHYSLVKTAKEPHPGAAPAKVQRGASRLGHATETRTHLAPNTKAPPTNNLDHKADMVWPLSSPVVASSVTPCSSLLAFALTNNNVLIWDKHQGLPRRIVNISTTKGLRAVHFLPPGLSEQPESRAPYPRHIAAYCLAVCNDGNLFLINTLSGDMSPPQHLDTELNDEHELPTLVSPVRGMPHLMLVCQSNGDVCLSDVLSGELLCHIILPETHAVSSPWKPVVCCGANGQVIYLKGESLRADSTQKTSAVEEAVLPDGESIERATETPTESLFVFKLGTFGALERYKNVTIPQLPFMVQPLLNDRISSIIKLRHKEQDERAQRLQQRWTHLKAELDSIRKHRSHPHPREHTTFTESSIPRTPLVIGQRVS